MIMYPIEENILKIHQYCARMRFLSQTNVTGGCLLAIHKNIEKINTCAGRCKKRQWGSKDGPGWDHGWTDDNYQSWEANDWSWEQWYGWNNCWYSWHDSAEQPWYPAEGPQEPVGDVS